MTRTSRLLGRLLSKVEDLSGACPCGTCKIKVHARTSLVDPFTREIIASRVFDSQSRAYASNCVYDSLDSATDPDPDHAVKMLVLEMLKLLCGTADPKDPTRLHRVPFIPAPSPPASPVTTVHVQKDTKLFIDGKPVPPYAFDISEVPNDEAKPKPKLPTLRKRRREPKWNFLGEEENKKEAEKKRQADELKDQWGLYASTFKDSPLWKDEVEGTLDPTPIVAAANKILQNQGGAPNQLLVNPSLYEDLQKHLNGYQNNALKGFVGQGQGGTAVKLESATVEGFFKACSDFTRDTGKTADTALMHPETLFELAKAAVCSPSAMPEGIPVVGATVTTLAGVRVETDPWIEKGVIYIRSKP